MREKGPAAALIGKFKSIQSAMFAAVSLLILGAVATVTLVSMNFTRSTIFENSSLYTRTIIRQMNQNIDSYIDYMENIAYIVSSSEDVQEYLFGSGDTDAARERILGQFETILDSRSDILNVGIIGTNGRMLINEGRESVNPDLDLSTQEWYTEPLKADVSVCLTSSHVQHIISGQRPWVITLSRGIRDQSSGVEKRAVFYRSELFRHQ